MTAIMTDITYFIEISHTEYMKLVLHTKEGELNDLWLLICGEKY